MKAAVVERASPAELARRQAARGPASIRSATAVLRRRAHGLRVRLPERLAEGLRLLPVLLHGSFQHPAIKGEAPGISGMRFRPGWGPLARAFKLPPPYRLQRGRCLIDALIALPSRESVLVLVCAAPGNTAEDATRLRERLIAAQRLLGQGGAALQIELLPAGAPHSPLVHRMLAFGCLLEGRLPDSLLSAPGNCTVGDDDLRAMLEGSTSPLSGLAVLLGAGRRVPCPSIALELGLASQGGYSGSPDAFCAGWIGEAAGLSPKLRALLVDGPEREALSLPALLDAARRLSVEAIRAARRLRRGLRDPLYQSIRRDLLGPAAPRPLLDLIARKHPPETSPAASLCGRTIDAAAAAVVDGWLGKPVLRDTYVASLRGAEAPAPPFDPLNRGPARELGFGPVTLVHLSPGRRPTARILAPREAVEALVRAAASGSAMEISALQTDALVPAVRLRRALALAWRTPGALPIAIEAGGRVLLASDAREVRSFALSSFARRPRRCLPDPESPDLSPSPEHSGRPRASLGATVLECRAELLGPGRASILTADLAGWLLREEIPLDQLEDYLLEAQAILRSTSPARILAIRSGPQLEAAVRRGAAGGHRVPVAVRGSLPFGLQVEIDGERYGAGKNGWTTGACAALAAVPQGLLPRFKVTSVNVELGGKPASGIGALYARSVALRKLQWQIKRLS